MVSTALVVGEGMARARVARRAMMGGLACIVGDWCGVEVIEVGCIDEGGGGAL